MSLCLVCHRLRSPQQRPLWVSLLFQLSSVSREFAYGNLSRFEARPVTEKAKTSTERSPHKSQVQPWRLPAKAVCGLNRCGPAGVLISFVCHTGFICRKVSHVVL